MDYSNLFVCLMGMGTVFFGLVCLVALTTLMSTFLRAGRKAPSSSRRTCSCTGRSRSAGRHTGTRGRCVRRDRGGSGHRYHRHPHPVH